MCVNIESQANFVRPSQKALSLRNVCVGLPASKAARGARGDRRRREREFTLMARSLNDVWLHISYITLFLQSQRTLGEQSERMPSCLLPDHCAKEHDEEEEHCESFDDEAAVAVDRLSVLEDLRVALLHVNRRLLRTPRPGAWGPTGGASRWRWRQRRASVLASIRSIVSPCSATTDVKR